MWKVPVCGRIGKTTSLQVCSVRKFEMFWHKVINDWSAWDYFRIQKASLSRLTEVVHFYLFYFILFYLLRTFIKRQFEIFYSESLPCDNLHVSDVKVNMVAKSVENEPGSNKKITRKVNDSSQRDSDQGILISRADDWHVVQNPNSIEFSQAWNLQPNSIGRCPRTAYTSNV